MENTQEELSFGKFFEVYKQKILPEIKKLETERIKLLKQHKIASILLIIFSALFILTFPITNNHLPHCEAIATFLFVGISVSYAFKEISTEDYKKMIKNKKIRGYITETLGNLTWYNGKDNIATPSKHTSYGYIMPSNVFSKFELDKSGLYTNFTKQMVDDEFKGYYKNVKFKISEIELRNQRTQGSGVYDFKGIIIAYEYTKKIKNRIIIDTAGSKPPAVFNKKYSKVILYIIIFSFLIMYLMPFFHIFSYQSSKLLPGIELLILFMILSPILVLIYLLKRDRELCMPKRLDKYLNKINLEDIKFNKNFNVYSSDEVEARYIVTPLFMELLNNLKTAFGTKELKCSFYDNSFMIAIPTKRDVFEIGDINVPCTDPKFILQFWRELSSIYKMIEYFRLNERTYTH